MKRILCMLIVCLLMFSLAACGGEQVGAPTEASTGLATEGQTPTEAPSELPTEDITEAPTEEPTEEPSVDPTEEPSEDAVPDILNFIVNSDASAKNGVADGPEITSHGPSKTVSVDSATGLNVATLTGGACLYNAQIGDYYGDMEDDFTLEVYFKVDSLPGASYAGIAENCENGGFGLYVYSDGKIEYDLMLDGSYAVTVAPSKATLGKWYHCVCVWDGTMISMYLDGVLVDEYESDFAYVKFPPDATAQYLAIGGCCSAGSTGGGGFAGSIGVCNLYTAALNAQQVANAYQNLMQ